MDHGAGRIGTEISAVQAFEPGLIDALPAALDQDPVHVPAHQSLRRSFELPAGRHRPQMRTRVPLVQARVDVGDRRGTCEQPRLASVHGDERIDTAPPPVGDALHGANLLEPGQVEVVELTAAQDRDRGRLRGRVVGEGQGLDSAFNARVERNAGAEGVDLEGVVRADPERVRQDRALDARIDLLARNPCGEPPIATVVEADRLQADAVGSHESSRARRQPARDLPDMAFYVRPF